MNIPNDVYKHVVENYADDRTILKMLSVNKKYNDDKLFQKVLKKRYPFLLKYKTNDVTWRQFYVSMIYYISKMKETFPNTLYIEKFDPVDVPLNFPRDQWKNIANMIIDTNNLNFIIDTLSEWNPKKLEGFQIPVFIKDELVDLLNNMNFDKKIKVLLDPLLNQKILSRTVISLLLKGNIKNDTVRKSIEPGKPQISETNLKILRALTTYLRITSSKFY